MGCTHRARVYRLKMMGLIDPLLSDQNDEERGNIKIRLLGKSCQEAKIANVIKMSNSFSSTFGETTRSFVCSLRG